MDIVKIGDYIREKRKAMNLTQGELAEILQISHQAVSRWENGENLPDVQKLSEMATLFRVTIDEIVNAGDIIINEEHPKSNLSFLSMINKVISIVSLILYFILLYSTGVYWIPFLVLFVMIIGFSLLYVIPFNSLKEKTQEDFKHVRSSIVMNAAVIVISIMSLFTVYGEFVVLIWSILLLVSLIVLIYPIHFLLKIYEIKQYTDDKTTVQDMIKKDRYIIPFITILVIFLVAIALTLAFKYGIEALMPNAAYIESLYVFQLSFGLVLLGFFITIIILKKQLNVLNIIFLSLILLNIGNWIYILTFVNKLYFVFSSDYINRIVTSNLLTDISGYILLFSLAFAIFYFIKFRNKFILGMRMTLYLLGVSVLMMLMIDYAYYFFSNGTYNLGGFACFDENMVFYYISILTVVLLMAYWLLFKRNKTKALD